ncbi:MAG: adenosine deaminase [Campylobacterota bacterium]|nr:adenosine deaminase [Campylobacterota bacterium]
MYQKNIFLILFTATLFGYLPVDLYSKSSQTITDTGHAQSTSNFYESMFEHNRLNRSLLHLFFTNMPKGGDIHHHYCGSLYAETYLEWVEKKEWHIDKCTLKIIKKDENGTCELLTVEQVMSDAKLHRKLLSLWSSKDYGNYIDRQPPADVNFFNTFLYFETVSYEYINLGLNILKQRAIKENIMYIETMLSMVGVNSADYFDKHKQNRYNKLLRSATSQKETDLILDEIITKYIDNKKFNTSVDIYISKLEKSHQGIDNEKFLMRYQTYAVRLFEPLQVFTDLFSGYLAAHRSPLIVGVNIVAPENNPISLSDYTLHMRMYNYLTRKYPTVHRALHAGELTLGMVRPKNLIFHIKQAIDIAKAQRIGHGVDISYEQNSIDLLRDMKRYSAVEINLTSNEFILGVKGDDHPYLIYSSYGVPIIISTDDSGVSRNNLTNEYMLLATRYHPSYKRIKEYVYNSIKYSFLDELQKNSLKKDLDMRFKLFEKDMMKLYEEIRSR